MKRTFVEAADFKKKLDDLGVHNLLQIIQDELLRSPDAGILIKGAGGIRKLRVGAKGKGKSGGIRVFYLDVPLRGKCYLLFLLEKSESENISADEKNELKEIAQLLKK